MIESASTPAHVAKLLGVNRAKIMRFIQADELKAVNLAETGANRPRYRILPADLETFLQSRKTAGPQLKKQRKKKTAEPVGEFRKYLKQRGRA